MIEDVAFAVVWLNSPAAALSSAHDRATALRLHRTVPAVEGGPTADSFAVGSRNQARWLSAAAAPGWLAGPLLHAHGSLLEQTAWRRAVHRRRFSADRLHQTIVGVG